MQSSEPAQHQPAAVQLPHSSAYISPSQLTVNTMTTQDDSIAPVPAFEAVSPNRIKQEHSVTSPRAENGSMAIDNSSEVGEDVVTKDRLLPKIKQVSKCSYCDLNSAESLKTVPCLECGSRCHIDCIVCAAKFKDKILLGDDFFHFKCFKCTKGQERFKRYHLSWVDVVHITLFNLTHNPQIRPNSGSNRLKGDDPTGQFSGGEHGPQEYGDSRIYFHYKADVSKFIDKHWSYFWTKSRGETWVNSASSALSTNSTENVPEDGRFESGKAKYNKNGMWALTDDLRFPSSYDSPQQQKSRVITYTFADDGSLILLPSQASGRRKRRTDVAPKSSSVRSKKPRAPGTPGTPVDGSGSLSGYYEGEYGSSTSLAHSKRTTARGKRESKNTWSISMWPDIDNPPGPAHMSREETHAATQFVIESDRMTVWNDKGYRMAKASHGVETGAWYFEVDVLQPVRPEFNLRIGWSQISGELNATCGYDVFSYSVRAKPSTRFHAAIGSHYGEEYGPGDTLGLLIYLPTLDDDEKQDLADRKWHPGEKYRRFIYSRPESQRPYNADSETPPLPVLSGSELVYFKNGKCLGPAFQKLYLGKYYPTVSSYMGGKVKVNLGPNFKYPPPATWTNSMTIRPISDLEYVAPVPAPPSAPTASETAPSNPDDIAVKQEPGQQMDVDSSQLAPPDASSAPVTAPAPVPAATDAVDATDVAIASSSATASEAVAVKSEDIAASDEPLPAPIPDQQASPAEPEATVEPSAAAPVDEPNDTPITESKATPEPESAPDAAPATFTSAPEDPAAPSSSTS
ncbi:transcription factor, contains a PHD finger motif [Coemansia erecta]|uniref:Transcription factor, contains a PHD finger motif n=1 Tax=Coemansia erecta TaxID=147472 RepID=A0A9W7Y4M5_9FUNG|nr:transcription factor, contains a PHD finger motif [Coemansia erecta]